MIAWPIVAVVASRLQNRSAWEVAAVAAVVCWFSATLSLVLSHVMRRAGNAVAGVLLGMAVRLGIPLLTGLVATSQGGALAEGGLLGLILAFYLITLTAETGFALALAKAPPKSGGQEGASHV